ncbi:MAG: hypothetical protein QXP80_00085 [Zestosphaera sp.]
MFNASTALKAVDDPEQAQRGVFLDSMSSKSVPLVRAERGLLGKNSRGP